MAGGSTEWGGAVVMVYDVIPSAQPPKADGLVLELINGAKKTVNLSNQSQYQNCNTCLMFGRECESDQLRSCNKVFIATKGSLEIVQISPQQPWTGDLKVRAEDVTLSEVTVNWNNSNSTLVPNGETVCIGLWEVDTDVENWGGFDN